MKTDQKSTTPGLKNGTVNGKSNAVNGLQRLFEEGLKEIYWAEKSLTIALSIMSKKATSPELREAFLTHLGETEEQITRLQTIFESMGQRVVAKKCEAMDRMISEGDRIIDETEAGIVRDAGIISVCQKIEHYEIATYGTLRQFAETLGMSEALILLEKSLREEKRADEKLAEIAINTINLEVARTRTVSPNNNHVDVVSGFQKLFEDGLKDIYWTEKALTITLSKLSKKATSPELMETLIIHLGETEGQIIRLQSIFENMGKQIVAKRCEAIDELINEADRMVEETEIGLVRDAAIISVCQKIKHYQIATYSTLKQFAETLGVPKAAILLGESLQEEKRADKKLTEVAINTVNLEVVGE